MRIETTTMLSFCKRQNDNVVVFQLRNKVMRIETTTTLSFCKRQNDNVIVV